MTTGSLRETCAECRFDSEAWTAGDLGQTLPEIPQFWALLTHGVAETVLAQRPAPGVWSAIEYADHMGDILNVHAFGLRWMLDEDSPTFPIIDAPPVVDAVSTATLASVTQKLADAAATYARELDTIGDGWSRTAIAGDDTVTVDWMVRHVLHDVLHHVHDIGRGLVALGVGPAPHTGTLVRVNTSDTGVPKRPVEGPVRVGYRGLEGDRQGNRKHHGRVFQALCLFSLEVIEQFQAEGHPIAAGSAGENLTVSGIDWAALRPGVQLRIGDMVCEITAPATPCRHQAQWFTDGDYHRMHEARGWDHVRWYANVLVDGTVAAGDAVHVVP